MRGERTGATGVSARGGSVWGKIGLLMLGLVVGAGMAEGVVRVFGLSTTLQSYRHPAMVKYREIFRQSSDGSSPHVVPGKEVVVRGIPYRINRSGFRDREFTREKPAGTARIAVLGDSVTFGFGVALGDSYPKRLEHYLRRAGRNVEVLNFGALHFDLPHHPRQFYDKALPFGPDIVVLQYGLNDIPDGVVSGPPQIPVQPAAGSTQGRPWNEAWKGLLRGSGLYLFVAERYNYLAMRMGAERPIMRSYNTRPEHWAWAKGVLTPFFSDLETRGIPVVLAYFPYGFQIYSPRPEVQEPQRVLGAYARGQGVEFVDVTEALRKSESTFRRVFLDDSHLSARGNDVAARVLVDAVEPLLSGRARSGRR